MNSMDRHIQQTNDRLQCIKQVSEGGGHCCRMRAGCGVAGVAYCSVLLLNECPCPSEGSNESH